MQPSSVRGKLSAGPSSPMTGTAAAYGHACTNCAKAKCKCIYTQAGGLCERCSRLGKQCQPSVPNRKRNPRKPPGSRTAYLEEKLDDLVSLIQANMKAPGAANVTPTACLDNGDSPAGPSTSPSTLAPSDSSHHVTTAISSEVAHTGATTPGVENAKPDHDFMYNIADDVAEECLARFVTDMVWYCPIVYVPSTMTASQLRSARPYLWLSIMACTARSLKQSHEIGDMLRQIVAHKLVLGFERSMDLLQALMVYMQWPHCHRNDQPFLSLWTHMAVTIAQDLGLTSIKGETAFTYIKKFWVPKSGCKTHQQHYQRVTAATVHGSQTYTMEDRRTTLAMFMWTSMLSHIIRRDNSLRWTPSMEESLRMLISRPEWEGDLILATQIRCHLVTQQITDISIQQALLGQEVRIPVHFQQALAAQVADIWRTVPPSVAQHVAVLFQLYGTEAHVHELALNFDPPSSTSETLQQLDALQKCLHALERWFQTWERMAPSQFLGLTFNIFTQKIQNVVALFRLSTVDTIPGWNTAETRKKLDVLALLERMAVQMETVTAAVSVAEDDPREDSIWQKAAFLMRRIKLGLKEEFNTMDGVGAEQTSGLPVVPGGDIPSQELQDHFMPNFLDEPWLSSIFAWDSMNF